MWLLCPQTNIEMTKEEDFTKILELEEQFIQKMCNEIIKLKPDVVFTEKGISDLAQHYLVKVRPACHSFTTNSISENASAMVKCILGEISDEPVTMELPRTVPNVKTRSRSVLPS